MVPPDLSILPTASAALWETVEMSFAGTLLGFLASLPLSILGTRHLFSNWISSLARFVAAGIRTIPVLLWAIVFVILVGLGPLAGTFGIAAYTVGYLAKIYADLFEGTDPEIMEAVQSTGASKLQLVRFVIIPETANAILAQVLFMLEYNIRASSILGFVGAGGLGLVDPDLFAKFGLSPARHRSVVGAGHRPDHGRHQRLAEKTLSSVGASIVRFMTKAKSSRVRKSRDHADCGHWRYCFFC